jgi:S-sulfo-L-cysteine synthase (3-phospho-L-serine-dependent)
VSVINNKGRIDSALDSLCNPALIQMQPNLFAAKFDLMKIVPARYILETALKNGELQPGGLVVESSSGTFALGLAMVCANLGLRLSLVTGPLEDSVKWRLEHLGATLNIVPSAGDTLGGIQQARLNRLQQVIVDNSMAFWPQQYTNPLHPAAYAAIAKDMGEAIGEVDFLVASVGSGGSMCGMARILRKSNPDLQVIGVDHNLSVLFGPTSGQAYPLCQECYVPLLGMGSDIVIANLDHTQCDEVHWLPVAKMINAVHYIHRNYGLLLGPTAGAAYVVADWIAHRNPGKNVLTIFPDHGIRYMQTIFDPVWLNGRAEELKRDWSHPALVEDPKAVGRDWEYFPWGRRSYREVMGHDPVSR